MGRLLLIVCMFCFGICSGQQRTGYQDHWIKPNGKINAIVKSGDTIYVGGDFTSFSYNEPNGAAISTVTQIPFNYLNPDGPVLDAISDGAGGWYIAGTFSHVGTQVRNNLARINADGSLNSWNPDVDGLLVRSLVRIGSKIYIGGIFNAVGGQARANLAAIDALTGVPNGWNPGANNSVDVLAAVGNTIYAGGSFSNIAGQVRKRAAAIDATSAIATAWNPNSDSSVFCLAISGNTIYIGGLFTHIGGQLRERIAAVDATTGAATAWNPGVNDRVNDLAIIGNSVYAGGSFTIADGQTRNNIAAFEKLSGAVTAWNPIVDGEVESLAAVGNTLYAGGLFFSVETETTRCVAAIDAITGFPTAWRPNVEGEILFIGVSNDVAYIGGVISSIGRRPRTRLAAIDAATGTLLPWGPTANGNVSALAINGNTVYAGGSFTIVNGATRNRIAAIDGTTGSAMLWNPNANNTVFSIATKGDTVYAGGSFTNIGGQIRNRIAALDGSTGLAISSNPNANAVVRALTVVGNNIYVGGDFTTIGGQPRNRIAALNSTTGAATSWNPNSTGAIMALTAAGSTIYAGGGFTTMGGLTRNRIAAIDAASGIPTAWNPNASDFVRALAVSGSTVYAAGDFTTMGGLTRNRISAIDAGNGLPTDWNPNAGSFLTTIAASGNTIYASGDYTSMGGNGERKLFMAMTDSTNITIFPPVITSLSPSSTICRNGSVVINFTASGYAAGNVFSAQLSNSSGSFTNPVSIGTLAGTSGGTINATISSNQGLSSNYRIRIVASAPATTGADNGTNLTVAAIPTSAQAAITPAGNQTVCNGFATTFSVPSANGFTYQWRIDGNDIAIAVVSSFTTGTAGVYSVEVTNTSGCSKVSANRTLNVTIPDASVTPFSTQSICGGGSVNFSAAVASGQSYQWQRNGTNIPGATGQNFTAAVTGGYRVSATLGGCTAFPNTVTVDSSVVLINDLPEICAVTVDSATGKNKIVWNKPLTSAIDSFLIFRKSNNGPGFEKIGASAYNVLSTFIDQSSDPAVRPEQYSLAAKNGCSETALSSPHTTMHLSINKGKNNNTWNLIWNGYEGFLPGFYKIFRGTSSTNMTLLNTIAAREFNAYTDATSPTGTIFYKITAGDGPVCNPTARTTSGEEDAVSSNIASNADELPAPHWMELIVYPNPSAAGGQIAIQSADADAVFDVRVLDISGRLVQTYKLAAGSRQAFGEELMAGIYIIEAINKEGISTIRKWVRE